jgi:hypothetical protein
MHFAKRVWRLATACVVANALALYAILSSLTPLPAAALGASAPGFEICRHLDPAVPAGHSNADEHCQFCLANGHLSVAAPAPAPLPSIVAYASKLRWAVVADVVTPLPASFSARPRGPPLFT